MSEASNTPSVRLVAGAVTLCILVTYGFAAFAFASTGWVQGDISPWLDGVLTVTFLLGFGITAMSWIIAIWLAFRRWPF